MVVLGRGAVSYELGTPAGQQHVYHTIQVSALHVSVMKRKLMMKMTMQASNGTDFISAGLGRPGGGAPLQQV